MTKKLLALLFALVLVLFLAACGGGDGGTDGGGNNEGINEGAAFSGTYAYNPPEDNYYIEYKEDDSAGASFFARIGDGYTYSLDDGVIGHVDLATGRGWMRSAEYDWMQEDYTYEEGEAVSFYPADMFEDIFMKYFRAYGFENEKLAEYFVGTEKIAGVKCWVFDSKGLNAIYMKCWVDPQTGLTLKYESTESGDTMEVTKLNLNYTAWDEGLKPASYD